MNVTESDKIGITAIWFLAMTFPEMAFEVCALAAEGHAKTAAALADGPPGGGGGGGGDMRPSVGASAPLMGVGWQVADLPVIPVYDAAVAHAAVADGDPCGCRLRRSAVGRAGGGALPVGLS